MLDDDDDGDATKCNIQDKLKGNQENYMEDDDDDEAPESVGFATSKDKVLEQIRYLCSLGNLGMTHSVPTAFINNECSRYRMGQAWVTEDGIYEDVSFSLYCKCS